MLLVPLAVALQQRFDLFRSRHFARRFSEPAPIVGLFAFPTILPQFFGQVSCNRSIRLAFDAAPNAMGAASGVYRSHHGIFQTGAV